MDVVKLHTSRQILASYTQSATQYVPRRGCVAKMLRSLYRGYEFPIHSVVYGERATAVAITYQAHYEAHVCATQCSMACCDESTTSAIRRGVSLPVHCLLYACDIHGKQLRPYQPPLLASEDALDNLVLVALSVPLVARAHVQVNGSAVHAFDFHIVGVGSVDVPTTILTTLVDVAHFGFSR